jgi:hypothetical protein
VWLALLGVDQAYRRGYLPHRAGPVGDPCLKWQRGKEHEVPALPGHEHDLLALICSLMRRIQEEEGLRKCIYRMHVVRKL